MRSLPFWFFLIGAIFIIGCQPFIQKSNDWLDARATTQPGQAPAPSNRETIQVGATLAPAIVPSPWTAIIAAGVIAGLQILQTMDSRKRTSQTQLQLQEVHSDVKDIKETTKVV